MKKIEKELSNDPSVICVHCHKKILQAKLIGITLVCPFCGKPSDRLSDKHATE